MRGRIAGYFGFGFTLSLLSLLAWSLVQAQSIAILKSHDIEPFNQTIEGFVSACNNQITEYNLDGKKERGFVIIKRLMETRPRLILAIGALAAQVAKEQVKGIPVVFAMVPNPYKYGLEGANIAGISLDIPIETQLTMYKSLLPNLQALGVIYDSAKTGPMVAEAHKVAKTLGLQLQAVPVTSEKAVPGALRNLLGKIDALWMLPDDTVITPESFQFLLLKTFENHLPFLAVSDIFVEVGALASLSPDYTDVGRQSCQLVSKIESSQLNLAEVNIFPPAKVNLAINLKTADIIGLRLPSAVVQSASKVYR